MAKTKATERDVNKLTIAELVDMKAEIDAKVEALKNDPAVAQQTVINNLIAAHLEEIKVPADKCVKLMGKTYQLEVGEKAKKRTIANMSLLRDFMEKVKKGLFLENCTVPLAVVDEWLNPEQCKQVLKEEKTGARRMKVVKIK